MAKQEGKKNWFARHKILTVILAVVVLGGIIGASGKESNPDTSTANKTDSSVATKTEEKKAEPEKGIAGGQYKVGADMPAGEYVIVGSGYLQISKDSSGEFGSILENDNYSNRTIIAVADGQYVQFSGRAYTWTDAPKVDTSKGTLPDGKYKVGVDFPAGEYKVTPSGDGYLAVSTSASESTGSIVTNDNFNTEKYITVQDGQYLKLNRASLKLK
jgi:hypothetical protein